MDKVVASRQRVSDSSAFGIALEAVSKVEDFDIPGPAGRIPVRLYVPHTEDSLPPTVPTLVYYHGGGFVAGDLESHDRLLRVLANRGRCIVVSVAYRLAPENPYSAGHDDAWAALMWVAAHASDIGADPQRLAVGGDSSGGLLAAWVAQKAAKDGPALRLQLLLYPNLDATTSKPSWKELGTDRVLAERERARLQEQNLYLQEDIKAAHNFEQIIGRSPALLDVLDQVGRVAPTDATVLVTGETGTGKELIARAVHSASPRRGKPLIKVNCAALPAGLVESELFGHEKGAFSGAIARRQGRFELADGGTLFLDEIGELPAEAQVKLLRVLQEREFDRVGGATPIRVDVRVIAATNRDLLKEVQEKRFREDLYYRLNVFPVRLPPLRELQDDIPLLVHFLVNKFAARVGKRLDGVSRATMERLQDYPWPGNVRELENALERAVILAAGPTLEVAPDLLPAPAKTRPVEERAQPEVAGTAAVAAVDQQAPSQPLPCLETVERDHIVKVLRHTKWVITGPRGAATVLGLNPSTLRSRIKKLGISRDPA
ncbi:MAG TPA: sigma 54-interacting transcriptional regulator [Gemmataceae bacterium]|nr:sigma 54-interacting transcriptional regulator [Gemmataceae bacterium]